MPNVSIVPGLAQSSTSTWKSCVFVPVDRITEAVPVNVACVFEPQGPLPMNSPLMDCDLIRTSIPWSSYSRFPVDAQHFTAKPNVACDCGPARLATKAGSEIRSPSGEKRGSPWTCPPPVTFPGVVGTPPRHDPPGAGAVSQGV